VLGTVICLSGLAVAVAGPVASAQTPVEPPEQPMNGLVFVDNPGIVDPHPMPVQSWSRVPDERVLAVHFTTGTPQCFGVHATAQETPDTVTVELHSGTLPDAVGQACIAIAMTGTLEIPLADPLGQRRVLSVY
jgi:hypothetical protein